MVFNENQIDKIKTPTAPATPERKYKTPRTRRALKGSEEKISERAKHFNNTQIK